MLSKGAMDYSSLILTFGILVKVVCCAEQCDYSSNPNELSCKQVQQNTSNITEFITELSLDKSIEWESVKINNKNFPILDKYLFDDMSIGFLDLSSNNIESLDDEAFDRIKDVMELKLSNNKLTRFKSSAVFASRCPNFLSLDLSSNNIRLIDDDSFNKIREISVLNLGYNSIERIDPGVFDLPYLTGLYLNGNDIKECVNNTFASMSNLITLSMDSNNLQSIQPGCFNGLESVSNFGIYNNQINESLSIFSSMKRINSFDLSSNSLTKISRDLLKGLTSVRKLYLYDNFISTIDPDAWKDLKSVIEIHLQNNLIQKLTPFMFKYANLEELYIGGNKINTIELNAFAGLDNSLSILDLTSNKLEYLKNNYFSGLSKLKTLNISDNIISFVEVGTFKDLSGLVTLNLRQNALYNIQAGVLSNLPLLTSIILRQNCLKSMRIFTNLTSLSSLDLTSNRLFYINIAYLNKNSPKLDKLLISDNIFENRSIYLSGIGIRVLDASETNLEVIKIDQTMSKLSSLNISNNPFLQSVEDLEYTGLKKLYMRNVSLGLLNSIDLNRIIPQLEELDLSHNTLDDVDIEFDKMNNMGVLRLSNTFKNKSVLDVLKKSDTIYELDLSGNRLSRVSISEIAEYLFTLNLANNKITDLNELGPAEYLKNLTISFNELRVIKKEWFEGFPSLEALYLSNNMIESIEPHSFVGKNLGLLNLKGNRLKYFSNSYFPQDIVNIHYEFLYIDVSSNNLNLIDLRGFDKAFNIYLSNSNLTNQKIINFRITLSSTFNLDLSFNKLIFIDQDTLSKAMYLASLNLSHNQIDSVESNSFSGLIRLTQLDLSHNQIASIHSNSFSRLKILQELDLSYNRITDLNVSAFDGLTVLTRLDLSHNHLVTIYSELFIDTISLKFLDLSYNQIMLVEDLSFNNANQLTKLSLDSNNGNITFSNKTFTGLESISFITISPEYFNSHENLIAVKESLLSNSGRYVSTRSYSSGVEIDYFRAISLNYPDLPTFYSYSECYNIACLTRNSIQLNVNSEQGVELFVTQCSLYFHSLLKDLLATCST